MRTLAALLLLCAVAAADAPVAKIAGPTSGRPGDILILDASGSAATFHDWSIDTADVQVPADHTLESFRTTVESMRAAGFRVTAPRTDSPPVYMLLDGGTRVLLASYPGTYRVSLAVGNAEGVDQLQWKLVVAGGAPVPPKPDDPDPPPPPPDKYGLTLIHRTVGSLIDSPNRRAEALKIAGVFASVRTQTSLGATGMIEAVQSQLKTALTADEKARWEAWRLTYVASLQALQQRDDWTDTAAEFAAAFAEIEAGLKGVN